MSIESPAPNPKKRVIFYIDGFNFYYGLKEMSKVKSGWYKYYWIDLVLLCKQFLMDDEELVCVRYFTATPKSNGKAKRQATLLNCNKKLNGDVFKIHKGFYSDKKMNCRANDGCGKTFMHWEEKQTDISIAVTMIEDCFTNRCDKIVLISGDSDLVPPIRFIEKHYPQKQKMIMFPPFRFSNALDNIDCTSLNLTRFKSRFTAAVMNDTVITESRTYLKPDHWKR